MTRRDSHARKSRSPSFRSATSKILLCAVSQTKRDKSIRCLGTKKYQHGVELMTVAKPVSEKLDSVNVDNTIEQR